MDFLHEIELAGERAYCHIDFQLDHTLDCGRRYFVYNGMMQSASPAQRNQVTDIIFSAPDAQQCLQSLRLLVQD